MAAQPAELIGCACLSEAPPRSCLTKSKMSTEIISSKALSTTSIKPHPVFCKTWVEDGRTNERAGEELFATLLLRVRVGQRAGGP